MILSHFVVLPKSDLDVQLTHHSLSRAWQTFRSDLSSTQSVAKIQSHIFVHLVTPKARAKHEHLFDQPTSDCSNRNTKGGSNTVPLTSCLAGLESVVWLLTIFVFICKTEYSKPVKQKVNGTVILPPSVFPALSWWTLYLFCSTSTMIFRIIQMMIKLLPSNLT